MVNFAAGLVYTDAGGPIYLTLSPLVVTFVGGWKESHRKKVTETSQKKKNHRNKVTHKKYRLKNIPL